MRLQHYLGKLFVALTRFPIEGISGGPNGELGRPKLSRTAWQRTPDIFVFRNVVSTIGHPFLLDSAIAASP
jgi:hypothetical protein